MRQGQSNRRTRGNLSGNAGGRRSQNPNRALDSSGPDVKIRGNAGHIFEKYQALARDAMASGDRIAAENYLQHAEHYHRLINSFNSQGANRHNGQRPGGQQRGDENEPGGNGRADAEGEADREEAEAAAEDRVPDGAERPSRSRSRGSRSQRRPAQAAPNGAAAGGLANGEAEAHDPSDDGDTKPISA